MSIETRIQAINDHLIDDYKVLRLAGADLTNIDKNIVNLKQTWKERLLYFMNNGTQEVWNNWNKVSGTGTTLSLNNTEEAPMSLTYKGNTSQSGTPTPTSPQPIHTVSGDNSIKVEGKNLFDKNNLNTLVAYIPASGTITPANGNYMVWFKIAQNTDFAISLTQIAKSTSPYVDDIQIGLYQNTPVLNATGTRIYSGTRPSATQDYTYTYSFNSGANNYIAIKVANNDRTDATATLNTLQLERGTQVTTYEEYKGASYPINLGDKELCKIGTYQDKIDKSSGKNIFSSNTWRKVYTSNGYPVPNTSVDVTITSSDTNNISFNIGQTYAGVESDFIPVKANEEYTLSFKQATNINRLFVTQYDSNKNRIGTINTNITIIEGKTFTTTNDGYIAVAFTSTSAVNNVVISLVQIEKGSTATTYEPYGTGWYLKKEIGKVVLDENSNVGVSVSTNYSTCYLSDLLDVATTTSSSVGYSNYFKINYNNVIGNAYFTSSKYLYMIMDTSINNSATFKTWLGNNNVILYYVLANPTYEYITDTTLLSQLEAMKQSYDSQTNISQTNNDLPFELNITALSNE